MKPYLSPEEWIKKVHGESQIEYIMECRCDYDWLITLMEWYGEYVARKTKKK